MAGFNGLTTSEQVLEAFAPQIKGRTFVITGAGHPSIGSQIVTTLAKASPAHIVIASRTASKVHPVLEAVGAIDSAVKTTFVQVDLSQHASVRRAAQDILAAAPSIHVLVNCAGVMAIKEYTLDEQGIEMQLSANYLGHFLLTNLLVPALEAAASHPAGARVVNISSAGYLISPFRFNDWNFSDGKTYEPWTAYGAAKTAQILFAYGLNKRVKARGITATALHPGQNNDTLLGSHLTMDDYSAILGITKQNTGKDFVFEEPRWKTLSQIAATPLVAILDPDLPAKSPAYLTNSQVTEPDGHAKDPDSVEKLWRLSEQLVGEAFTY